MSETIPMLVRNHYKVLSILGEGGFGKTFLVEDTHLPSKRKCVLKQLKPVQASAEMEKLVRDRFEREATTLEKLGEAHEQIPRLYAHFEENGKFYLVEEWIEGLTLTQKVREEGPLRELAVQKIIADALPVIEFIHSQKIVHRDIKPDNIVLRSRDQIPVLIDFGAVKESIRTVVLGSGAQSTPSIVVGTPGYMPMEQVAGRPVYASDIYSLGMTAIFLLTGKQPHEFGNDPQTGLLNWRSYALEVSTTFTTFLNRAISVVPQARFANIQEMYSALEQKVLYPSVSSAFAKVPAQTKASNAPKTSLSTEVSAQEVWGPPPSIAQNQWEPVLTDTTEIQSNARHSLKTTLVIGSLAGASVLLGGLWLQNTVFEYPTSRASTSTSSEKIASVELEERSTSLEPEFDSTDEPDSDTSVVSDTEVQPDSQRENNKTTQKTEKRSDPSPPGFTREFLKNLPGEKVADANAIVIFDSHAYSMRGAPGGSKESSVDRDSHIRVFEYGTDKRGYPWYKVEAPSGETGWLPTQVVQLAEENLEAVLVPDNDIVPYANATVVLDSGFYVRLRERPGLSDEGGGSVSKSARVRAINSEEDGEGKSWYEILGPDGAAGWIPARFVQLDDGATFSLPAPPDSIPHSDSISQNKSLSQS